MTTLSITNLVRNGGDDARPYLMINPLVIDADNLPALQGSEKQVSWADKIRAQALEAVAAETFANLSAMRNKGQLNDGMSQAEADALQAKIEAMYSRLAPAFDAKIEAGWWIDNRSALTRPGAANALLAAAR